VFQCPTSEIWGCLDRYTGIQYCAKVVENPRQADFTELDLFHNLSQDGHPSLACLVDVFIEANRLVLVTQWEKGGNLMSKVYKDGPLKEEDVKAITRSLLKGCHFLHSRDIVHADLQPENVLLSGGMPHDEFCAKITDFGNAVNLRSHGLGASYGEGHGTCGYSAPEILEQKELDTQADMWSLGCLAFFMLTGRSPFEENPSSKRHNTVKALRAEYSFPSEHFQHVSRSAKQFICSLIITDPSVRMTAAEALEHPWLRVEEEPQPCIRRRSSLGNAVCSDPPLLDSSLMCMSSRQSSSASPCHSPARKSGKKHHRRLSSLSKTIGKLFQAKDLQQTLHPLKKAHVDSAPDLCSSTYSTDPSEVPHITSASSWTAQPKEKTKKHRRFFTAGY
jgi:serine/threonine protein kinase